MASATGQDTYGKQLEHLHKIMGSIAVVDAEATRLEIETIIESGGQDPNYDQSAASAFREKLRNQEQKRKSGLT